MGRISAIDPTAVHRICSGQVVNDIATAVKELVENSLDSGASTVDVRLKSSGLKMIEVEDDGSGILEDNFHGLTLKHHTSKLSEFDELRLVGTFGFRGEALSSLCALCDVTISTKHANASIGHRMEYDHEGHMTSKTPIARRRGTTVILRDVFSTLPVRHKELARNIRKEYGKLLNLLSAYCIVATGVKISCHNEGDNGKKVRVLSTGGAPTMDGNISEIFGTKQLRSLRQFQQCAPTLESCDEYQLIDASDWSKFKIHGYVSTATHGHGRASPDRQFYFINSRPITLQKLSKLVNEVYHGFNRHQFPFVSLNIETERGGVDVNVTPDKRKVFIEGERGLLAGVKSSLVAMFSLEPHVGGVRSGYSPVSPNTPHSSALKPDIRLGKSPSRGFSLSSFRRSSDVTTNDITMTRKRNSNFPTKPAKQPRLDRFMLTQQKTTMTSQRDQCDDVKLEFVTKRVDQGEDLHSGESPEILDLPREGDSPEILDLPREGESPETELKFSLLKLSEFWESRKEQSTESLPSNSYRARIDDNEVAEAELTKNLNKTSFQQMELLGQFNLGFIITCHNHQLFIIDQHASDEICNFEKLRSRDHLTPQTLVTPHKLQLTPADKLVVGGNIGVFRNNGFNFRFTTHPDTHEETIHLTQAPIVGSHTLDASDVSELIFMLSSSPGVMCRPTKIRRVLASKACRMSVMIGRCLSKREMTRLVRQMSEINHPWNCPHGRPTMRHLIDLSKLPR